MSQDKNVYKNGYFEVTDGHSLYYELYGNPKGKPALFLHGGPGYGFHERDRRFFDPEVWNVLFFDQRGAGKSKPFASLHENNTPKLIEDINSILNFVKFDKVFLFGGSWGSTLALIYAIQNKNKVTGMLLRGVYYGNSRDIQHMLNGPTKQYFPKDWERFMKLVPEDKKEKAIEYYLEKMTTGDDETKKLYCYEWSRYESAVGELNITEEIINEDLSDESYMALSPIEAIYMANKSFVPENYILDNAHILSDIPVSIVHGRYDFVCPPINSWDLHKKIDNSKLYFVVSGHASTDPELDKKLKEEMAKLTM